VPDVSPSFLIIISLILDHTCDGRSSWHPPQTALHAGVQKRCQCVTLAIGLSTRTCS
jgi:hypothetical protein